MFLDSTLAKKIDEANEYKRQIDALKYKLEQVKEELKADMIERGKEVYEFEFDGKGHKVSYKTNMKTKFDSKGFKEKYANLYESFTSLSPEMRLLFS